MNKNTFLNLNIASYFLNILASPDVSTCFTIGGPIKKTIKQLGLTKNHPKTVEITWHMVNRCKEMDQEHTGKTVQGTLINLTFYQIRMNSIFLQMWWKTNLASATQPISSIFIATAKVLVQCVIPLLIWRFWDSNIRRKRKMIQKIQQGTNNEGKWKEARRGQTKKWLIMLNQIPEDKG